MKTPKALPSLLSSFSKRHHIGAQLTASRVIAEANRLFVEIAADTPLVNDVRIVSYKDGTLLFACRHAAAMYAMQKTAHDVARALECAFPALTVHPQCQLRTEIWKEYT